MDKDLRDINSSSLSGLPERTLGNVLRGLSRLVAKKGETPQAYKDAQFKQYWMPDKNCKECYDCGVKFSVLRRRHHCRVCGQVFCSSCSNQEVDGKLIGYIGVLRCCDYCARVVKQYMMDEAFKDCCDSSLLSQEDFVFCPQTKKTSNQTNASIFDYDNATQSEILLEDKNLFLKNGKDLRSACLEMIKTMASSYQHKKSKFNYKSFFPGSHIIDWLLHQQKVKSRQYGCLFGQAMLEAGLIEDLDNPRSASLFQDNSKKLYKFSLKLLSEGRPSLPENLVSFGDEGEEPLWVRNIKFCSDATEEDTSYVKTKKFDDYREKEIENNFEDEEGQIIMIAKPSPTSSQISLCGTLNDQISELQNEEEVYVYSGESTKKSDQTPIIDNLQSSELVKEHFRNQLSKIADYLLEREGLSNQDWKMKLMSTVEEVCSRVKLDVKNHDNLDIKKYIKIKKILTNESEDWIITNGLAMSKAVTHRKMVGFLSQPRILLLDVALQYQRLETKISSFEPQILQEEEYLGRVSERILSLQPHIIFAGKSVARLVQDFLFKHHIALVINVKRANLQRLSRIIQSNIVSSMDGLLSNFELSICKKIEMRSYDKKFLMHVEGTKVGLLASVLIHGSDQYQLIKLKKCLRELIFVLHHLRNELALLFCFHGYLPLEEESKDCDEIKALEKQATVMSFQEEKWKKYLSFPYCFSISPNVEAYPPYLETGEGKMWLKRVGLKQHPKNIFYSKSFEDHKYQKTSNEEKLNTETNQTIGKEKKNQTNSLELNSNIKTPITQGFPLSLFNLPLKRPLLSQNLLALYRAQGENDISGHYYFCRENSHFYFEKKFNQDKKEKFKQIEFLDCLEMRNHQNISLLFYSFNPFSPNFPSFCVLPWVVNMTFYTETDMSLGSFLDMYCFNDNYKCVRITCDIAMALHVRRFVHKKGCVEVSIKKNCSLVKEEELEEGSIPIFIWSQCAICFAMGKKCRLSTPAYNISLGKYLELRFCESKYLIRPSALEDFSPACCHSLNQSHIHFFQTSSTQAIFKYSEVDLFKIYFPLLTIPQPTFSLEPLHKELSSLESRIDQLNETLMENLIRLRRDWCGPENLLSLLCQLIIQLPEVREGLLQKLKDIESLIKEFSHPQSDSKIARKVFRTSRQLSIDLQRQISFSFNSWLEKITNIEISMKKNMDKQVKNFNKSFSQLPPNTSQLPLTKNYSSLLLGNNNSTSTIPLFPQSVNVSTCISPSFDSTSSPPQIFETVLKPSNPNGTEEGMSPLTTPPNDSDSSNLSNLPPSNNDLDNETNSLLSRTSVSDLNICDTSDKKVNMKNLISNLLTPSSFLAFSDPTPPHIHFFFLENSQRTFLVSDQEPSSIIAYALSCKDYIKALEQLGSDPPSIPNNGEENSRPNILSFLITKERTAEDQGSTECDAVKYTPNKKGTLELLEEGEEEEKEICSKNKNEVAQPCKNETKKSKPSTPSDHIEIQFSDSWTKFYCKIFYAEKFSKLRRLILQEEDFIDSMSVCCQWRARGGKSGSNFSKTKDNRFILKQVSMRESQSFNDFAPHYLDYITHCYHSNKLTTLAKIVGVFKIVFQNSKTMETKKQELLVIENLFFNSKVSQIFDLKGSTRNRYTETCLDDNEEVVLLDENLLRTMLSKPFYTDCFTKQTLMATLASDTDFLSRHLTMDYSLLLGIDSNSKTMVLGIIDYIRTFTWEKRVEMIFKATYANKMPTVVSPEVYRKRFMEAMARYFLPSPDMWHSFQNSFQI